MNTELVVLYDECPRKATWSAQYALPAIPLAQAMQESLRMGLLAGEATRAKERLIEIAADPGLDMKAWNLFDIATHHAAMLENVCAYLLGNDGPWKAMDEVEGFHPESYLMDDGRLRRVVLCSTWNELREWEERISWRTLADVCVTNRPMLINAIVIGNSRTGFRPTPWTQGFVHPENHILRVKKKEGRFTENWKKVYRESTDKKPLDWLTVMQQDDAFAELVFSVVVEVPENRKDVLESMYRINKEIARNGTEMRRSACYRFSPCVMARLCHGTPSMTPAQAGWSNKVK